jgi:molecular chaperone HtpG
MTYDDLVNNLGTIAKSGTLEFLKNLKTKDAKSIDLIGQFGVGFYSAFMVSSSVEVRTKSPYSDKAYLWTSEGEDSYTVEEIEKADRGTEVTLFLRNNEEEENYDEFLETWKISSLVKKYSDYVRYPIKMDQETEKPKLDKDGKEIEDKFETVIETKTLNSMTPIWNKSKAEVKPEELNEFYKNTYFDYTDPLSTIWTDVEGALTYKALVFIPGKAPYNLYSEKYEKGLQLYAKGVFVMDKCKELVPDYLRFLKGLVVSPDLSLNISREILQHNRQLVKIAANLEKKILSELEKMLKNEREKYETFFKEFGIDMKYGIYDKFGEKKDSLQDLILFKTVNSEKLVTLKEYVEKMPSGQTDIFYGSAPSKEAILVSPQMDLLKSKNYDVLVLSDDIDEFMINILREYDKHPFKSINQGDLNLVDETEKATVKTLEETNKDLLEALKTALASEVKDVKLSTRLTDSPVCLVSGEGLSFEMEKVINQMPGDKAMKADKILEINPKHELFHSISAVFAKDPSGLADYAWILFNQALLMEGLPIKDPVAFSEKMIRLMIKAAKTE